MSNVDAHELAKFSELAHRWWDRNSEFRPLHDINPLRLDWIDSLAPLADRKVVDVGCGGGILAESMAVRGARVTGITLSEEQLAEARRRAEEAGLAGRVRFELMDYRAWDRPVDRIVSVGMFEHVGIVNYTTFFRRLRDALKPDGVALVHAIGRMSGPYNTNPWIAKYIFPGGYSPALSEVVPAVVTTFLPLRSSKPWIPLSLAVSNCPFT